MPAAFRAMVTDFSLPLQTKHERLFPYFLLFLAHIFSIQCEEHESQQALDLAAGSPRYDLCPEA